MNIINNSNKREIKRKIEQAKMIIRYIQDKDIDGKEILIHKNIEDEKAYNFIKEKILEVAPKIIIEYVDLLFIIEKEYLEKNSYYIFCFYIINNEIIRITKTGHKYKDIEKRIDNLDEIIKYSKYI